MLEAPSQTSPAVPTSPKVPNSPSLSSEVSSSQGFQPFSSRGWGTDWQTPLKSSSGLWAQKWKKLILIYFLEENVKECASLSGIPDYGSWGLGREGWESLPRAPQMTSRVTSFMSQEHTLCQGLAWAQGTQEQIKHGLRPQELPGRGC